MKKLLAILSTALAAVCLSMLGAVPANAAVVITLDADGTSLPVAAAAADWSKNTDVTVVAGNCTGPRCVHFKMVDTIPCSADIMGFVGGCAYKLSDGSCQVEVKREPLTWPGTEYLDDLIVKHEAGHCIWGFSGKPHVTHLPNTPHALMSAQQPIGPTRQEATLTRYDRDYTRTLF